MNKLKCAQLMLMVLLMPISAYSLGGNGATCNPATANWGFCPLSPVPFQDNVTKTINVSGGTFSTPYEATQANTRYVLQGDIIANSTGIVVKANYVIIDLNGHTITYNKTSPGEGVTIGDWGYHHVSIRNGTIIQGTAMSEGDLWGRGNNPVGCYNTARASNFPVANLHVANLSVRYGGRDVGGIICAGNNGLYEQNTLEDTYQFGTLKNRHEGVDALSGVKGEVSTGIVTRYNTIINARQRGIDAGDYSETYGNHITIRSIATNSYGIWRYGGKNASIHDNTIVGRGEHPIGIGAVSKSKNITAYNNLIDLQTTALGIEYGSAFLADKTATHISNRAAGIRVTWGGNGHNFHNNTINIATSSRYVGTYSPTGETAYINGGGKGLFAGVYAGEKTLFSNNTITVVGDGDYTMGIACTYNFSDGLFFVGNTVTTDQKNIVIGDEYGACNGYPLFSGNTLIKTGSNAGYTTIANTYNETNSNAQARFSENVYQNGASESSVSLLPGNTGLTDVYFDSVVDGIQLYNYRLYDNNGASETLLQEYFAPAIDLPYLEIFPGRRYAARLSED